MAGPAERITLLERHYMASMGSQRNKGDAAASEEVLSPFLLASLIFFLVGSRGSLGFKFYWGGGFAEGYDSLNLNPANYKA